MQIDYVFAAIAVIVVLNCLVSFKISRRDDLERVQVIAQIIIVWIIPYIGAIGLWVFHRSFDATSEAYKQNETDSSISVNGNTTNYDALDGGSDGGGGD